MRIGDICIRNVQTVHEDEALVNAVFKMHRYHIGAVVAVAERQGARIPIGIVTDRDVLCGQIRRQKDIYCLTVGEVMTPEPLTLQDTCTLAEAIERMASRSVRRAPVVDGAGHLIGLISVDDVLPVLANGLGALAKLIGTQSRHEREFRGLA